MKVELDPARVRDAEGRSNALREQAAVFKERAAALEAQARQLERTWGISAPCDRCGSRDCDDPLTEALR